MDTRLVLQALINVRFAVRSFKTWFTFARVVSDPIDTVSILTRTTITFVDIDLTVLAHRSRHANAFIAAGVLKRELLHEDCRQVLVVRVVQRNVGPLQTLPRELTRVRLALVDVFLTVLAVVSGVTLALVIVHLVDTLGPVGARIRLALVNVQLTEETGIAGLIAVAQESSQLIDTTAAVLARLRLTIIDVNFAKSPRHSRNTHARKIGHPVDTGGPLRARVTFALVDIRTAVLPAVSRRTNTLEIIFLIHTLSIIFARMAKALIHIQITVQPGVPWGTEAPKRARRILADSIHTDLILNLTLIDIILATFALEPG